MTKQPEKLIRWTLNGASVEFGLDRATLRRRLADAQQSPDSDGTYSTRQITGAVFGDDHAERHAHRKAARQIAELELAKARGELLPAAEVEKVWSTLLLSAKARWEQLPVKSTLAFSLWPDARACEAWLEREVNDILTELALNPDYTKPDGNDQADGAKGQ